MRSRAATLLCFIVLLFPVSANAAAEGSPPFRRGVSLQIFTFPAMEDGGYARDPLPSRAGAEDYFSISRLRASGFDHVRLPVDIGPFLDDPGQKAWNEFRLYFRRFVQNLDRNGLHVIVTLIAPSANSQIPEDQLDGIEGERFKHYRDAAERFAAELENWRIKDLALEPMNEPQRACKRTDVADWLAYQDIMIPRLRAVAPHLWLGLTGGCWSKIEGLEGLNAEQLNDRRTFVSVHFYDPFLFTHQGSDWSLDIMPLIAGLPYPAQAEHLEEVLGNARARAAALAGGAPGILPRAEESIRYYFRENTGNTVMLKTFRALKDWSIAQNVAPGRIVFTEFGAMKTPGGELSRARWFHDVTSAIGANGWGWTLWVLRQGPFGLDDDGRYDPALFLALGTRVPKADK
ncbi:MAG TPA: cellulase family glycosylhydrolase [Afipia sp.]